MTLENFHEPMNSTTTLTPSNNTSSETLSHARYRFPNIMPPSALQAQRRAPSSHHYRRWAEQANMNLNSATPIKPVYKLTCRHCSTAVCARGMKAILLADTSIELYSTDTPSQCIHVLEKDYLTRSCHCRIRDVACLECGNILGYHVVSPCAQCLASCNNGHFWMFHSNACEITARQDKNKKIMAWSSLPRADMDLEFISGSRVPYEQLCR